MKFEEALLQRTPSAPDVGAAVVKLRKAFGETQPQFAARLKATVRTITRYENVGPPGGQPLLRLWGLARKKRLQEVADVFRGWYIRCVWEEMKETGFKETVSEHIESTILHMVEGELRQRIREDVLTALAAGSVSLDLSEDERGFLAAALAQYRQADAHDRALMADFEGLLERARWMEDLEGRILAARTKHDGGQERQS
jgi:transcriptional regulator with XRE-family HTH domain